jgi:D-glycero-alpha-D-manno-heptose 1-phosphate guanylyltransferase
MSPRNYTTSRLLASVTSSMPEPPNAIVLCGGAGLRLRPVIGQRPKPMADVSGRPFLEIVLQQLRRNGIERVILAVGYKREAIQRHFHDRAFGLDVVYSIETEPLGTGGALRHAVDLVESESVLALNGDSYTDTDLTAFANRHCEWRTDVSVVVVPPDGRGDCGSVRLAEDGTVLSFQEKPGSRDGAYINAGIYFISRRLLREIPQGNSSLEQELVPRWLQQGKLMRGFIHSGSCLDIGTPERYRSAQDLLAQTELETNGASTQ